MELVIEFQDMLHREFPKGASEWLDSVSRRGFLQLMGASLAMAGMTGCTKLPLQEIVPYVRQPEQLIPGVAMYYATAFTLSGYANPLLVESHLGRPTKIEGNNLHPASLGGTDVFAQASILGMYDPDRSQAITHLGDVDSWATFAKEIKGALAVQKTLGGAGVRILTQTISSPTLKDQMQAFLAMYPKAKWHVYEPVNRDNALEGAKLAFGEAVETRYDLSKADVIVSLDADFLYAGFPGNVRYIRDFAKRRSQPLMDSDKLEDRSSHNEMNQAEPFRPSWGAFSDAVAIELQKHLGSSLIVVGDHQPPAIHFFAHQLNSTLGNVGKTVFYTEPVDANPVNQTESIKDLVGDIRSGKVDLLVILGGNPAYDAPADLDFGNVLKNGNIPLRVHLGLYQNETAELCHWHVNQAHELEAWGDARAYDGTVSIVQPLIAPLYDGKSAYEMVAMLSGQPQTKGHELVRGYWQKQPSGGDFEAFWRKSLHDGWIEGTALTTKQVGSKANHLPPPATRFDQNALELNLRRDPTIY